MKSFTTQVLFAILALSLQARAEQAAPAQQAPLTEAQALEAKCGFLYCALLSSETMLGADDGAICSINFELVKNKVFGGNFSKLMEFWQANKTKEAYAAMCKPAQEK